jgi:arylsulfatase A-like enzyme
MRRATASFAAAALIATLVVTAAIALPGCGRQPAPPVATGSSPAGPQPAPVLPTEIRSRAARANVLIVSLDSARADHCGSYGYPRETTPCIDDLARESVVFERHFTDYPETLASIASLLTGTYADTHESGKYTADYLTKVPWTLPAALHAAGYRTALFSAHPMVTRLLGDAHVFQTVAGNRMGITALGEDRTFDPSGIVSAVSSWLDEGSSSPFFAYVHLMPPHHPYATRDEYGKLFAGQEAPTAWQGDYPFPQIARDEREKGDMAPPPLDEWVDRYDASLLWGDWGVGQLEALLREKKLLDKTILVVTSDHGEAFGEHGYIYHVFGVYDELLHVPLLIRLPGGLAHRRVPALTQTVDVSATVLDMLGMDRVRDIQGNSLLPLMSGEAQQVRPTVFARAAGSPRSYLVRTQDWALILYEGGSLRALYDLKTDPKETRNVLDQQPEVAAQMIDTFRAFASTQKARPLQFADPAYQAPPGPKLRDQSLDTEMRRDLKALGYL